MKTTRIRNLIVAVLVGALGVSTVNAQDKSSAGSLVKPVDAFARMSAKQARETEAYSLGVQTVLWGMQWVKAGQTLRVSSAALPEGKPRLAVDPSSHGINVWGHAQALLTYELRIIETPNTETLYSSAVVDLKDGPIVVVHPNHGKRYFRTSIWELSGDTHTISQKKDGARPPAYALIPSGWTGKLPDGLKTVRLHSRYAWVVPHIAVYGEEDIKNVVALQKGYKLIALKHWGASNKELAPGQPMRPIQRLNTKTPPELLFFEELCETLKDITLREDEVGFARQAGAIGVTLKDGFQFEKLDPPTVAGLKRAVLDAQSIAEHKARTLTPAQAGGTWLLGMDITSLDDWLFRGAVGWKFVWGDLASEILYPMARGDAEGMPLTGINRYTLHFPKSQLPAARYWRISLYDLDGYFVANPLKRAGIGNMAEKLQPNADGSLTLYIQHDSPGKDKEVNWLPAPDEGFFLIMRMYQPEERMYSGDYILPPVVRK